MTDKWNQQYLDGQARYFPHEELVRFLGRAYGSCKQKAGEGLIAAEIGSGAGGNLVALEEWGFDPYGYDVSIEAMLLAKAHVDARAFPNYSRCSIIKYTAPDRIPNADASLDLVIDVQCIQHLNDAEHSLMYSEIARVLKPGGRFFSVHWKYGDQADIFPAHPELRETYAFELLDMLHNKGLTVTSLEECFRTYNSGAHRAAWHIIEAVKP